MYGLDLYRRIRIDVLQHGVSQREVALRHGVDRGTVAKIVEFPEPPGYRRNIPPRRPQLNPHIGFIDQILLDDLNVPKKQRQMVQRIHDRLRHERGFTGGYARRTFLVPIPSVRDFAELNAMLEERCRKRQVKTLRGRHGSIGERLTSDRAAFMTLLPETTLEKC